MNNGCSRHPEALITFRSIMLASPSIEQIVTAPDAASFTSTILDIRTPECFAAAHIEGAINFSVYQTDFLTKIPEALPDKNRPILVYGEGAPFKADLAALARLEYLGYTQVQVLAGGLSSWKGAGLPIVEKNEIEEAPLAVGSFTLDTARTKVRWVGRNLMNQHNGAIASKGGALEISDEGIMTAGAVTVDMSQMICHDIQEAPVAKMLIEHLESVDFFDTANHPTASFTMASAAPISGSTYGKPNYRVCGILDARGQSIDLEVDALLEPIADGYVFQTSFDFDRTLIGALYGAGSIFERLGMHLVNDLVSLDVTAFFVER